MHALPNRQHPGAGDGAPVDVELLEVVLLLATNFCQDGG